MTNQNNPYEPLTSENAALVLVDHQVGLFTGVRDLTVSDLKHNVVALAKAAKLLGIGKTTLYKKLKDYGLDAASKASL